MGALTRALEEGLPMLDGSFLAGMTEKRLREVLRGEGDLILFSERVEILREVGRGLVENYGGTFRGLMTDARGSAVALSRLLADRFPSFNDACSVEDREIRFYKRAQLAPAMIYQRFQGKGLGAFHDIDDLTVFADYKLPQALRRAGILRYGQRLAARVDSRELIPPCSLEEIEIRACTIWACELIKAEYARMGQEMNSVTLDAFLWLMGHAKTANDKPYHLTETIYY
ncbi:MAG: queuosine salvage family protein [bacterium]